MTALPDAVRTRVVGLAADALGTLRTDDVPARLRAVARFAGAKRARLGAGAIAAVLDADATFRARVADTAAAGEPELSAAINSGSLPAAADPVDVAVLAYLLRPDGWEELIERADVAARRADTEARAVRESAAAQRLREQLAAARAAARDHRDRYRGEIDRLKAENAGLRRRLNDARERAASARDAEHQAESELGRAVERAEAARAAAEAETRRLRSRLADAEAALETVKRAGREGRGLETARLGLLIDTLAEAAAGLRRELALPATAVRPADTVLAAEPSGPRLSDRARSLAADDPAVLADLLALPKAHLIVDGYNVTKTAWPAMPLEAQRNRLVQGLGALAARTGAEITCVFDGADVAVPPPVSPAGGVRVRFSQQGSSADELIGRLARAEPPGRPVIVVSTDQEVADGVVRAGARSVPSTALVRLLGR